MDTLIDTAIEYNPETMIAKEGIKIAGKEVKREMKDLLKSLKKELNKTSVYFGLPTPDEIMGDALEIKNEVVGTIQEASQYGITSVLGRPLKVVKHVIDFSNNILHPDDEKKSLDEKYRDAQRIAILLDTPNKTTPTNATTNNPTNNPTNDEMKGGKREKEPLEEVEDLFSMLINHRLWVLKQAKNRNEQNINKNNIKKIIKGKKTKNKRRSAKGKTSKTKRHMKKSKS